MKKLYLFILLLSALAVNAQTEAPYKRISGLPPINILLGDSTTHFTKSGFTPNKKILLMVFSPDCSHCQHETEDLIEHKNDLTDVQIVMITLHPLWQMNEFVKKYKLDSLSNVTVGKDYQYFTPGFFEIHNLPFIALYDKKGKLIQSAEGTTGMDKIVDAFSKAR